MTDIRNVIIIGSGPAGWTAALYCGRAQLEPLVFEGELVSNTDQPGGQLMLTTDVENYPGFPTGIQGPELMARFREQAERFGAEIVGRRVTAVDLLADPKRVYVGDEEHLARAVIVATGARARMLGLPNEQRLLGHGVSTCATCDGFFFRDQRIAVVGGGDSAMEEALFLTRFGREVTVIHRRDRLRASRIMQERAFEHPKIGFRWNRVVSDVLGDERVEAVELTDTRSGDTEIMEVDGLFIAIGHEPATELFRDQLATDENGYLITGPGTATNVEGVFAAGDVQDHTYRQAVTAAGSGCMAAIDAERWLAARS